MKGNNTAGKYVYWNAGNVMGIYYTNNEYISPWRMLYDYGYSRATATSHLQDTLDEPKPYTSSHDGISCQPYEKTFNDT
jgi:hypothetical protein